MASVPPLRSSATPPRGLERNAVLLVEDNPDDVLLIERAFRKTGLTHRLVVMHDGEEAVEYFDGAGRFADRQAWPLPMLTLLDLKLPRRSGIEVLQWLRGEGGLHGLPVVVLTSSNEQEHIGAAYRAGANSYLLKPVQFAQLLALVQAVDAFWIAHNVRPDDPAAGAQR